MSKNNNYFPENFTGIKIIEIAISKNPSEYPFILSKYEQVIISLPPFQNCFTETFRI